MTRAGPPDRDTMTAKVFWVWVAALCCAMALQALGLVCVAVYLEPENQLGYTSRVSLWTIAAAIPRLSGSSLAAAATWREGIVFVGGFAGLVSLAATRRRRRSLFRAAVFASQGALVPWGWPGIGLFLATPFLTLDGEWLAEGTPTLIAAGLWILYSLVMAGFSLPIETVFRRRPRL